MKRSIITISYVLITLKVCAQVPVEVLVGHEQIQHEFFFFKDLDKKQKLNLFSMARFAVDYEDANLNSSFISSQVTYNLTPRWGISAGANYAEQDVAPLVALSYTYINEKGDFFINLFPMVFAQQRPDYELFGMAFYAPQLNEKWSFFSQLFFGTNVNHQFNRHQFSYQQLRVGLGLKDWFQFGLGLDQNMIGSGEGYTYSNNIGLFIRKEL